MSTETFDKDKREQAKARVYPSSTYDYIEVLEDVARAAKQFWAHMTDANADVLYAALDKVEWMEED